MGTPAFAVPPLEALLNSHHNIIAVVTAPDKPAGRGRKISHSPVKEFALKNELNLLQPLKLKDPSFIESLKLLNADLQVVVAFRLLPEPIWNMPPLGTFNLHASLLPQYRGAAPINHAIINGETETGLTTFFLDNQVDTGNIIMQEKVRIEENDNAGTLHDKLMSKGAQLVVKTVDMIHAGNCKTLPQKNIPVKIENLRTAPKIKKQDCLINWLKNGTDIVNHIRGLSPSPSAFSFLHDGETKISVKLYEAVFIPSVSASPPGTIDSDNKKFMNVTVKDGYISIKSLQLEGKNKMNIAQFLAGFRNISRYRFA